MDYRERESPRVRQNRRENKKWRDYYKKHKKKILETKPTISASDQNSNYDYLHVQLRLKKLQMEEDRFAMIDYENRKLLERIINVVGDIPAVNPRRKSSPRKPKNREAERIERENERLNERLENVKPFISSATETSTLVDHSREKIRQNEGEKIRADNKYLKERIDAVSNRLDLTPPSYHHINHTREKLRQNEEQKIIAENKNLKERIDAARNRLDLTPPSKHETHRRFEDRYENEARRIDEQNLNIQQRLEKIIRSGPNFDFENEPQIKRRTKPTKSFSADNREMKKRIENIKSTIDFGKIQSKPPEIRPKFDSRFHEEKIIQENKEMQKRILKIMSSSGGNKMANDTEERESPRRRRVEAWTKAIEKENKILHERLMQIKPAMSTRIQNPGSTYVPYNDPFQEENKRIRERLARIRRGEAISPINKSEVVENEGEAEVKDEASKEEEEKKPPKKEYIVPEGYHKKFRKKRPKVTKKPEDDIDNDDDFETDTDSD